MVMLILKTPGKWITKIIIIGVQHNNFATLSIASVAVITIVVWLVLQYLV